MPPSGYNSTEAKSIMTFLASISESLIKEGKEKGISPSEALKDECENIFKIESSQCSPYQSVILALTRHFYKIALLANPKSYEDLRLLMKKELATVESEILGIHVPEI